MSRKPVSVRRIAIETSADVDEILVTSWDLGIDHVSNADSKMPRKDAKRLREYFGIATKADLRSPDYWADLLCISRADVKEFLLGREISMGAQASKIPSGGVRILKAEARSRGIDPLQPAIKTPTPEDPTSASSTEPVESATELDTPDFNWELVGHERPLRFLSTQEVTDIHFALVRDFQTSTDPISPPGVKSHSLLDSALFRPQTSFGATPKYPTVETAASALLHSIVLNHSFHNGNKRTALVSMLVFLDENGLVPTCDEDDLFRLVLRVAQHRVVPLSPHEMADREVFAISKWLCNQTRVVIKGEKPIQWRKLKRILTEYGCVFEIPASVGSRLNIDRTVTTTKKRLWRRKTSSRTLHTQVYCAGDGRDAEVNTIQKIRQDLWLDDLKGIDSRDFYSRGATEISDFIAKYRKTLYRLGKL